jgi:hypothetical protein
MFMYSARIGRGKKPTAGTGGENPGGGGGGEGFNLDVIPKNWNDAIFTGMSEQSSTLEATEGSTYNNYSWNNFLNSSYTVGAAANTTYNKFRIKTNEGFRIQGGDANVVVDQMYMEVYSEDPADHADGTQWYGDFNPGTCYSASATVKNTHIRGLENSFTTYFIADWMHGTVSFENCLFTTEGTPENPICQGVIIYSQIGCPRVQVSMKNCYFQDSGWQYTNGMELDRLDVTTEPCKVILWDNVRYCTWDHATSTLVPGDLIPQPPATF